MCSNTRPLYTCAASMGPSNSLPQLLQNFCLGCKVVPHPLQNMFSPLGRNEERVCLNIDTNSKQAEFTGGKNLVVLGERCCATFRFAGKTKRPPGKRRPFLSRENSSNGGKGRQNFLAKSYWPKNRSVKEFLGNKYICFQWFTRCVNTLVKMTIFEKNSGKLL